MSPTGRVPDTIQMLTLGVQTITNLGERDGNAHGIAPALAVHVTTLSVYPRRRDETLPLDLVRRNLFVPGGVD